MLGCNSRARLKQRLEASHEGLSTEDGSSSVTSGLDDEQAAQADMMMRRLVKVHPTMITPQQSPQNSHLTTVQKSLLGAHIIDTIPQRPKRHAVILSVAFAQCVPRAFNGCCCSFQLWHHHD